MPTLTKILEIYAVLFIVFGVHEMGHFAALRLFGGKVSRLTVFYGSIVSWWHQNTYYSIGIIPGGLTECANFHKLDQYQQAIAYASGILASSFMFMALAWLRLVYCTEFINMLTTGFALDLLIGIIPMGNNDAKKFIQIITRNDHGKKD